MSNNTTFTISDVARLTGVSPITLRAWENRYQLIQPERTSKGHRIFSAADVARVQTVVEHISNGVSVGKVKALLDVDYNESTSVINTDETHSVWQVFTDRVLAENQKFSVRGLDKIYNELIAVYPLDIISKQLFLPLIRIYRARIMARYHGAVAEEHFLANYIRNRLAALFQQLVSVTKGELLLFAALPNCRHDFFLLLFAIYCLQAGYSVVSLGMNTPFDQVEFTANKIKPKALIVFGELSRNERQHFSYKDGSLFVHNERQIQVDNVINLKEDFNEALAQIRAAINHTE